MEIRNAEFGLSRTIHNNSSRSTEWRVTSARSETRVTCESRPCQSRFSRQSCVFRPAILQECYSVVSPTNPPEFAGTVADLIFN
jgi:hypothetical protein